MRLTSVKLRKSLTLVSASALIIISCGDPESKDPNELPPATDTAQTTIINISGEKFSIPSPIQTAFLIKNSGAAYSKAILNPAVKTTQYSSNFSKAVNLGIYGADLAYVTMYDQTQDAMGYMKSAKTLADELSVSGAFDNSIIDRFTKNLGNKDSMLSLTGVAYRASDAYLKNNNRDEVSGLILAGGWLESLHFATNLYQTKPNDNIKRRIAEQKSSLQSLIKLLNQYYSQPEYAEFIDGLKDLATVYDSVEFTYTFVKPTTDAEKKLTIVNSKTDVKISDEQIKTISEKVKALRSNIVG